MVGQMNRRVSIQTMTVTTDVGGGTSLAVNTGATYNLWAEVKNRTGQASYQEGQRQVHYDYEVRVRYFSSKIITTKNLVLYDGKQMIINSVEREREGNVDFLTLRCSVNGGS